MKSFTKISIALAMITLAATSTCFAAINPVPEIDPSMGAGALALLGGAVMVLRGRRK